jgi:hypothetical protein
VVAAAVAGKARLLALLALFAAGTAVGAGAGVTAFDVAGRYTHSFRNGDISGASFTSSDEVVIVPTDARHAVFDMELAFFNGHQCSIGGLATIEGNALVYRDPEMAGYGDGGPCILRIQRRGGRLTWDDRGTCSGNCGARGSLRGGSIAWSSRRPVSRAERTGILTDYERNRHLP